MFRRLNVHIQNFRENIRELRQNSARMYELSKSVLFEKREAENHYEPFRAFLGGYPAIKVEGTDSLQSF
jgi:hypothetical protein